MLTQVLYKEMGLQSAYEDCQRLSCSDSQWELITPSGSQDMCLPRPPTSSVAVLGMNSSSVLFGFHAVAVIPRSVRTDRRILWFTLSKPADRSSRIRTEDRLADLAV